MKIIPIILLIQIAGLSGFIFPLSEAEPLLESIADDSDEFIHVVVGAHAVDAFVATVSSSSSSSSSVVTDQWHQCLQCTIVDAASYDSAVDCLQRFLKSVHEHAAFDGGRWESSEFIQQWIERVHALAQRHVQTLEMLSGVRGRRTKKKSFWKPFLAGAALVGMVAAGYVWWTHKKTENTLFDMRRWQPRAAVGSAVNERALVDTQSGAREGAHQARIGAIVGRAAARVAPYQALQQAGRQWMPRLAPELCTYLQEHKGLVVHQVTQTQMLVNMLDRRLRSYVQYAYAHQDHDTPAGVLRVWADQDLASLLGTEQGVPDDETVRHVVQQSLAHDEQFGTLVSVWCGQMGGREAVAALKRMVRNEQRAIGLCDSPSSPLLQRHPEYYSIWSRFLVRTCHEEIAAYARGAVHEEVVVADSVWGKSVRDVQHGDIQRYHSVGGVMRSLDEWVYLLRDTPDLQDRAITVLYREIIAAVCRRFECDEASARTHLIGSLWAGRRTRQILRAVYNREVSLGAISGARLPANTSHSLSSGQMMSGEENDSSDDDNLGAQNL